MRQSVPSQISFTAFRPSETQRLIVYLRANGIVRGLPMVRSVMRLTLNHDACD